MQRYGVRLDTFGGLVEYEDETGKYVDCVDAICRIAILHARVKTLEAQLRAAELRLAPN
jgi:hypothetical protein